MSNQGSWQGKETSITVDSDTNYTLKEIVVRQGASYLWAEVTPAVSDALQTFLIQEKVRSDATYVTVAQAASDFIPATASDSSFVDFATHDMTTLAAGAVGMFRIPVKGLYSVKLLAKSASSDNTVDLYWAMR